MPSTYPLSVCAIVPTHDRPELLRRAVASIVEQCTEGLEVVVVDDASEIPATDVLRREYPQVTVLRNSRPRGPAAARNQGVSATEAELVAFLDDDDVWLPGKLEACIACFQEHPETDLLIHRMVPYGSATRGSGEIRVVRDPVSRMLMKQPPHVGAVVVRRESHERVRFDESFPAAADLDYMLRLAMTSRILELDRVLSMHGPSDQRVSAIKLESRIAARKQFRAKHEALFEPAPVEAFYELRLGHLYRRAGLRSQALVAFARSFARHPSSGALKGMGAAVLPESVVTRAIGRSSLR